MKLLQPGDLSPSHWAESTISVYGLSSGQQLAILSALASESVVMLIGSHGTAKSMLPMKLAEAMGQKGRYFPAHMMQLEDLVGWVAPDLKEGELVYFRGNASIFNTEFALFDEIARTQPSVQAKFLEILLERKVLGEATPLQQTWLAANPAGEDYHAAPLDVALVARVGVALQMPSVRELSGAELGTVISSWNKADTCSVG